MAGENSLPPGADPRPGEPPRPRRRRWGRGFLAALFLLGLAVGAGATALAKTRAGQRLLLDAALSRVRAGLAGTLVVEDLRSPSLLGGGVLVGVRLEAAGGRRFFEADSLRVRYSILSLVGAPPRIAAVTAYGARVEISRYPGEEELNVARLVAPSDEEAAPGPRRPALALGSVRVVGGTLEVLTPLEGEAAPRTPTVPSPDGEGQLRRLALDDLDLLLEGVVLGAPDTLVAARLAEFSSAVHVLDQPLVVTHARGTVRYTAAGLDVADAEFRLPSSLLAGALGLGPTEASGGPWAFGLDVASAVGVDLADLAWLDRRLPAGVLRGALSLEAGPALQVRLADVSVEMEASRLELDGGIRVDDGVELQGLEVRGTPLALARLEPWVGRELPVDGWLSGSVRLEGRPAALGVDGRVTLVPTGHGGGATTADLSGVLHLGGGDRGVTNLRLALDPLNLRLAEALWPAAAVEGSASASVDASGRVSSGIRFAGEMRHGGEGAESRLLAQGTVRRPRGEGWEVDVRADASPLALALVSQVAPAASADGAIEGWVQARGPLSAMEVEGEVTSAGGSAAVEASVDLEAPGRPYRLDARLRDLDLGPFVPTLPEPFRWTGRVQAEGRGFTPDSAEAVATISAAGSRVAGLRIDTVAASLRLLHGTLEVDSLSGRLGGFRVAGSGRVGIAPDAPGEMRVSFSTGDLVGIRPLLMGETVMARDTLSVLERQLLRLQGVDADTLPLLEEVAMAGTLDGDLVLSGTLSSLGLRGGVRLRDAVYGAERVGAADVHLDGRDLTGVGRRLDLAVEAMGIVVQGRTFDTLEGLVGLDGRSGDAELRASQPTGERYHLAGAFAFEPGGGGRVRLERADLAVDSVTWALTRPAGISWDSASVTLADVEITRGLEHPMRLRADGTLAWRGASALRVEGNGVRLDLLARLVQWEGTRPGGVADARLEISGDAEDPSIRADVTIEEPRWGDLAMTVLEGRVRYERRQAEVDLSARRGARRAFRAEGSVPVDLALRPRGRRVLDRPMDVRVEADSLEAALALTTFTALEDVVGAVSGDFHLGGTLDRPEPAGVLTLSRAGWTLEALGVRHEGVAGTLTLNPDRTLDVAVDGRAVGTSSVRGKVILDPLTDAGLDLAISFRGFQALDRRDMTGLVSGEVRLLGSYRAPRVEGALSVDRGTLFLEEFVRSAEVVDLTDPRIFEVVDTTALSTRPLLAGIRNPFLQNLRADVSLSVPRDTWLRSEQMNVEIGGELLVRYDRVSRDVVMVGELEALRGSYTVLGRRFDVQGGTVGFIGTPGVNPTLDIRAVSRVRRVEGDPLDVTATVEGTLTQPRVSLSSEEQGVAESDLVSYLIFGRPSHELVTGQEAWLGGGAGSLVGAATGAGVTFVSGTLAARLGAALSQQIGVDYLSITQAGDFGVLSGSLAGSLAGTQVEVGQYLTDRIFFMLIFRPIQGQNTNQGFFGGARLELALTDDYNVQAFWEDRFLRSRVGGFGDLGLQASQVLGVFIFREWGY